MLHFEEWAEDREGPAVAEDLTGSGLVLLIARLVTELARGS